MIFFDAGNMFLSMDLDRVGWRCDAAIDVQGRTKSGLVAWDADIAGARAAGIHAVLLEPWGDWPQVGCPGMADLTRLAARRSRRPDRRKNSVT